MVKFYAYDMIKTADTILEFRGGDEQTKVNYFTGIPDHIVSIVGEQDGIDAVVATQAAEINVREIAQEEFQTAVSDSDQIAEINRQVKQEISRRYDTADEIAMLKRSASDPKRIDYEAYVTDCLIYGDEIKASIGYE